MTRRETRIIALLLMGLVAGSGAQLTAQDAAQEVSDNPDGRVASVVVAVESGIARSQIAVHVLPNPVVTVNFKSAPTTGRVGDVVRLEADVLDAHGNPVVDAPVAWSEDS